MSAIVHIEIDEYNNLLKELDKLKRENDFLQGAVRDMKNAFETLKKCQQSIRNVINFLEYEREEGKTFAEKYLMKGDVYDLNKLKNLEIF